jgi:ankyrin repeat protein
MGNCDIVRLLLEAGADANAAVEFRELTPLHLAIASGNHRIVELLVQLGFADV